MVPSSSQIIIDDSQPQFAIAASEWTQAIESLSQEPSGSKKSWKHSFIKINNKIYCLAKEKFQDPVITQGTVSKVKYAQDEAGDIYIIKIDQKDSLSFLINSEATILQDLGIGLGSETRSDQKKKYTVVKYLGKNLKFILAQHADKLTEAMRFEIAIQLCNQVYRLHHGLLSLSKKGYAHNDVKLDNITIDKHGQVRLIDFGLAQSNPFAIGYILTGATRYTAYVDEQDLSAAELDVVSLKRVLFIPDSFYCFKGFAKRKDGDKEFLLSEQFLTAFNLHEFISTFSAENDPPDYTRQVMDPLVICAALINAFLQLGIKNAELRNNKLLCHALVGGYFSDLRPRLKEIIADTYSYNLAGAMHYANAAAEYDELLADRVLASKMSQTNNATQAYCLLKLGQMRLPQYYDVVVQDNPTAQSIEILDRQGHGHLIPGLLEKHRPALVQQLSLLCRHNMQHRYASLINSPNLVNAFASLPEEEHGNEIFLDLLSNTVVTEEELIRYCLDDTIRKAFATLVSKDKYSFFLKVKVDPSCKLKPIFESPEVRAAIDNCIALGHEGLALYRLIEEATACRAFNILYAADFFHGKPQNRVESFIYELFIDSGFAQFIVTLHEHHLDAVIPTLMAMHAVQRHSIERLVANEHLAKKLTVPMLLDKNMHIALCKHYLSNDLLECLFLLFNKNLITSNRLQGFVENSNFLKFIADLIKKGKADWITAELLTDDISTTTDCLLKLVSEHPEVLGLVPNYCFDAGFMSQAIRRNINALKYASADVLADTGFMQQVGQISYQTLNTLNDQPEKKLQVRRGVLHYKYASDANSRFHLFSANLKAYPKLEGKYPGKSGDALKTAILEAFKQSLEGKTTQEIMQVVSDFKQSQEYDILCSSQGLTTYLFGLKTSSYEAVEHLIEAALSFAQSDSLNSISKNPY